MSRAPTQAIHLGVEAIDGGVVRLVDDEFRAVLEVGAASATGDLDHRLEATLAGYGAFLNTLSFPIQIVVRAVPVDLVRYVGLLEERARQSLPAELAGLAHDHAAFVQALARQRTLVERRFYVVVPSETGHRRDWRARFSKRRAGDEVQSEVAARQLDQRCGDLSYQLGRCGVHVRRLSDLELAQLYLSCWSPERGRAQRFRQRLDEYTTLAVRAARPAE